MCNLCNNLGDYPFFAVTNPIYVHLGKAGLGQLASITQQAAQYCTGYVSDVDAADEYIYLAERIDV